jgi:hypothetical protein
MNTTNRLTPEQLQQLRERVARHRPASGEAVTLFERRVPPSAETANGRKQEADGRRQDAADASELSTSSLLPPASRLLPPVYNPVGVQTVATQYKGGCAGCGK